MKDFIIFRHPGEGKVLAFEGSWVEQAFTIEKDTFWIRPFNDRSKILHLDSATAIDWEQLHMHTSEEFEEEVPVGSDTFMPYVEEVLSNISSGTLKKAVPARRSFLKQAPYSIKEIFTKNLKHNPNAFCYLLSSSIYGLWLGASPETFFDFENGIGRTVALAGTRFREGHDSFSRKEFEEQNMVSSYIRDVLKRHSTDVIVSSPISVQAAHLDHLKSRITCKTPASKLPEIIQDLHPTPAVGGFPRLDALALIQKNEQFSRSLYSGWLGQTNKGILKSYVNLRCAQLFKNGMLCFAGCGVNQGSIPEKEFEETESKMQVMQRLLKKD
ncbi:MAG: chorismate-binding protein [Bacteroidia bacterium]|nr:chorismate-binding protein [Bacteroidia bacterium]